MPITLRPLHRSDAAAAAAVIRGAFAAQPVELDPPPSALGVTAEVLAAHASRIDGGGALAQSGERIVGVVLWDVTDGFLQVSRLAVDPRMRRQGIARALLGAAEAVTRERGLPLLRLGTRLALAGNRRLFAGCGFVETGVHAHPGYAEPTWVEMEKRLG